jgi:ribosomal protein S18 acetylase RimI-like enzyme
MQVNTRRFDPSRNDFEKMWRFLQQDYARRQDRFVWLFSRLGDWKYGLWNEKKVIPSFFRDHAQLWVDGFDELLGFVLSEDGNDVFFIFTSHGYGYLYADILDWTIRNWLPRYGTLKSEVHEYQDEAVPALEKRGFRNAGLVATTRAYDLVSKAEEHVELASGFRIVDMREAEDFFGKGLLYINGFEGRTQISDYDLLRFKYSRESPAYDPSLDLSVVTDDGTHVASCVGFYDPAHCVAEVEKICTHQQYRRQGLAEAVIRECFHRLCQRKIERAYITGYSDAANRLYERLGPCQHKRWYHYEMGA